MEMMLGKLKRIRSFPSGSVPRRSVVLWSLTGSSRANHLRMYLMVEYLRARRGRHKEFNTSLPTNYNINSKYAVSENDPENVKLLDSQPANMIKFQ